MAYLVLASGAVLTIWGAVSMYFGYGIVEVERGWTGVIAGATCLAGGMIVMALALVIKSLRDLRGAMAALPSQDGSAVTAPRAPADAAQYSLDFKAAPARAEPAEPETAVTGELQSGMLAAIMSSPAAEPDPPAEPLDHERPEPSPASITDPAPARPPLFEIKAPDATYAKPRQNVTMKPQPAPPRQKEPLPDPEQEQETGPSMDDWLDRAFSALDNEVATSPAQTIAPLEKAWPVPAARPVDIPSPEPLVSGLQSGHVNSDAGQEAHEQLVQDRDEAVTPAVHGHALEPAQPEIAPAIDHGPPQEPGDAPVPAAMPAATPLVLEPVETGRYETDGTTYIMYSDGAIDVQSEAGVYHFASMAELKAYIEGTG